MPWYVVKSSSGECPVNKPWAVKKKDGGKVVACHETAAQAAAHSRALYANVNEKGMSESEAEDAEV